VQGRIVLGVSGGIAAYKSIEVLRELIRCGNEVRVIMTRHATEFIHPRTFAVLSEHPVEVDQWQSPTEPGVDHVAVSHWADLLLVAPATANTLAKMAHGIADDALGTYHLAHRRAVLVAPAMNTIMWRHPATRANIACLRERGVEIVPPAAGMLACGDEGEGRLAPIEEIVDHTLRLLPQRGALAGIRVLVSAGPTREPIDPVRVIANRSSGRMGVALAAAARDQGAVVTLLHGPLAVPRPPGVTCIPVETAAEMGEQLDQLLDHADAAFLAAAVSDLRPRHVAADKLDRRQGGTTLELEPVPDLAAAAGARSPRPYLVVFAAETGPKKGRALAKMRAKGADAVILNDITAEGCGMGTPTNEVWVMTSDEHETHLPRALKNDLAREILTTLAGEIITHQATRASG